GRGRAAAAAAAGRAFPVHQRLPAAQRNRQHGRQLPLCHRGRRALRRAHRPLCPRRRPARHPRAALITAMDFLPGWPLSANTLFFFGFLLFCGALGGYVAHRWRWLPSITGFMVVGFVAGPNVLGVISATGLAQSRIVVDVALALILYRLGLSIDTKRLGHERRVVLVSLTESALSFCAVYFGLGLVGVTGLAAAVIATIAVSSSPAVLIHVAHELRASGPVTERAMLLVAL